MADYLTTDTELTSVADAIRTKGGTSASLVYPTGFVSAINAISTGTDVSDTTAAASDVRTGKYFYTSAGVKTQGSLANGSATTPATTITANPSISVDSSGLITATTSASQSVTPTVSAGYVSSGTAGTVTVSGSNTSQLTTQAAQIFHPSATDRSISSGTYLTGAQVVKGVWLTNLDAANIKKDVVVKVGDSSDDDCLTSVTGTYEGTSKSKACFCMVGNATVTVSTTISGYRLSTFTIPSATFPTVPTGANEVAVVNNINLEVANINSASIYVALNKYNSGTKDNLLIANSSSSSQSLSGTVKVKSAKYYQIDEDNLVSFTYTYFNKTFNFVDGMTWEDFVYSTGLQDNCDFQINLTNVRVKYKTSTSWKYIKKNGTNVLGTDLIDVNGTYSS